MFQQDPPDLVRANVAQCHQHLQVGIACQAESLPRRREVGAEQAEPTQLPVEHVLAGRFVACAVELVEPAADLFARAAAGEEAIGLHQPVTTRLAGLCRHDLDAIAAGQLVVERNDPAVDLGPAAAMADLGVDPVGEVQRGGTRRQVDHLPLRGQHIDAVLDQFGIEFVGERCLVGLDAVRGRLQQLAHPGNLAIERGVAA